MHQYEKLNLYELKDDTLENILSLEEKEKTLYMYGGERLII